MRCLQRNINNEITYVIDDPYAKAEVVQKYMKTHDRIVFIDFGIGVDDESLDQIFQPHDNVGCLVFPGVNEGIDWDMFKEKIKSDSKEPPSQMGLHFDTRVGKKISKDIYQVASTDAKVWMINTKNVLKSIKDKKSGSFKIYPKMFEKFTEQGVRIYAFTAAKLTTTYTHECISNILNAAGVKVN
tara:strand:- start:2749 stop:3303 length:555 start_codon:yes stop_codon:yes gene_type:complete